MDFRRAELKAFLRTRRAAVQPETIGLPRGNRRLTSGLRREELAQAAGVGLTWYTWLEQGREIAPSAETLRRIARALRLSHADEAYLYSLAGVPHIPDATLPDTVPPAVQCVLHAFLGPAVVLDPMFNLVATNNLAQRLYDFDSSVGPYNDNQLWQLFLNSSRRALYPDYGTIARAFVSLFRLTAAADLDRPDYQGLVRDLAEASAEFADIWGEQTAAPLASATVRMYHPSFGDLEVCSVRSVLPSMGGSLLLLLGPANDFTRRAFAG